MGKIVHAVLLALALCGTAAAQQVSYYVQPMFADENFRHIQVSIRLPEKTSGPRTLMMPRAIPMGYGWQPYDRFVSNVKALTQDGTSLEVKRLEGPRWQLGSARDTIARVDYVVDLRTMEAEITSMGDASRWRSGYVFLLGYSIFAFVDGMEDLPVQLFFLPPQHQQHWFSFSTLTRGREGSDKMATATAENFYALADSQILFGPNVRVSGWGNSGPKRNSAVHVATLAFAEGELDLQKLSRVSEETFSKVEQYFAGAPFAQYTAIFEYLKPLTPRHTLGFSMEHLNSATFCLDVSTIPKTEQEWSSTAYNIAHHMAHAWIPKRAYGEGYFPFSWEIPPLIDTIWFSEGFAQYAAADALADALPAAEGDSYRQRLVEIRFRSTLREMPALLKRMPLVELSKLASTMYSEDFRIGRTVFSRGALMAAEMDALIRTESKGQKRLRDALRGLVAWSAREKRAFRIEELPAIFQAATGVDTRAVLEKWLAPMMEQEGAERR